MNKNDTNRCIQVYTLTGGKWDKMHELCCRVYSIKGISPTINTCSGGHREPKIWMMMKMDEEKEIMKSCNGCIHCPVCYKIEHYGRDTYSAEPCEMYMGKADVAPVVHGHWVYNPNGMDFNLGAYECSICRQRNANLPGSKNMNPYNFVGSKYCPNCGAKMDEEDSDEKRKSC